LKMDASYGVGENTPHSITGLTPAELFLKRAPRTRLTLLKPSLQTKVHERQQKEKQHHDGPRPVRLSQFDMYQHVRIRNMRGGKEKWIPGTVTKILGPPTYIVRLPGNNRRTVHVKDQCRYLIVVERFHLQT
ncbi:hypothetical protein LSAT2_025083, partial [Lamellibrachia satsuma]